MSPSRRRRRRAYTRRAPGRRSPTQAGRPLALAALAAALATPAQAQSPCVADAQRLCQGIAPGGGRIHACLKSSADRLSPACRLALAR